MAIIHGLEASVKQEEGTKKKKIALVKFETLESIKWEEENIIIKAGGE